ncbi:MAG: hypothetical protein GC200_06795 [Tepidisphaera sp.]|nr:hypothetical protein [Tepidisphaera sp.]
MSGLMVAGCAAAPRDYRAELDRLDAERDAQIAALGEKRDAEIKRCAHEPDAERCSKRAWDRYFASVQETRTEHLAAVQRVWDGLPPKEPSSDTIR